MPTKRTKMLPVRFDEAELDQIRAQAEAEGRTLQDFAHEVLMQAVAQRKEHRRAALDHVLRVSEGLNARLAR